MDWIPRRRGAKKSSSHWKALNITCGMGMWFEHLVLQMRTQVLDERLEDAFRD